MWKVMRSSTVASSTSPFCSQSKRCPIVLSSLAMYPSRDIDAEAMTCPIQGSFSPRFHPVYRPAKRDEVIDAYDLWCTTDARLQSAPGSADRGHVSASQWLPNAQ